LTCLLLVLLLLLLLLLVTRGSWDLCLSASLRYGLGGSTIIPPACMQVAYNHLFLCYRVYGPQHCNTLAALKGVEATDPQAWVPQLLAGLTWPSVEFDLDPVKGSKAEATVSILRGWVRTGH
jgi:hypothetical protein